MEMFDPVYVTEVINDILSRRGLQMVITPKEKSQKPAEEDSLTSFHGTNGCDKAAG